LFHLNLCCWQLPLLLFTDDEVETIAAAGSWELVLLQRAEQLYTRLWWRPKNKNVKSLDRCSSSCVELMISSSSWSSLNWISHEYPPPSPSPSPSSHVFYQLNFCLSCSSAFPPDMESILLFVMILIWFPNVFQLLCDPIDSPEIWWLNGHVFINPGRVMIFLFLCYVTNHL